MTSLSTIPSPSAVASEVIWAFGKQSKFIHAYCGKDELDAGHTLCGNKCMPVFVLNEWNAENHDMVCPICRSRLPFVKYSTPYHHHQKENPKPAKK